MVHDRIAVTTETTIEEGVKTMEEKRLLNPSETEWKGCLFLDTTRSPARMDWLRDFGIRLRIITFARGQMLLKIRVRCTLYGARLV
jgi:hypothetical protein